MQIILLRHGATEWNLQGRCQGVTDLDLNDTGLRQAAGVATALSGETIAALNRVAPYLRGLLGKRIEMRFTPSLKFVVDDSFAKARRIDELLARPEVARDLREEE